MAKCISAVAEEPLVSDAVTVLVPERVLVAVAVARPSAPVVACTTWITALFDAVKFTVCPAIGAFRPSTTKTWMALLALPFAAALSVVIFIFSARICAVVKNTVSTVFALPLSRLAVRVKVPGTVLVSETVLIPFISVVLVAGIVTPGALACQ